MFNNSEQSQVSRVSPYQPECRVCLKALEALALLAVKYAFSHLFWYRFFFKISYLQLCRSITKILVIFVPLINLQIYYPV